MTDNRIGSDTPDGRQWPAVDVNGAVYGRPASTMSIGGGAFVVIPAGFNQWQIIDEIKAAQNKPVARRGRGSAPETVDDETHTSL